MIESSVIIKFTESDFEYFSSFLWAEQFRCMIYRLSRLLCLNFGHGIFVAILCFGVRMSRKNFKKFQSTKHVALVAAG